MRASNRMPCRVSVAKSSARWLQCDELTSAPLREKHKKIIYTQLIILSIDQISSRRLSGKWRATLKMPSTQAKSPLRNRRGLVVIVLVASVFDRVAEAPFRADQLHQLLCLVAEHLGIR